MAFLSNIHLGCVGSQSAEKEEWGCRRDGKGKIEEGVPFPALAFLSGKGFSLFFLGSLKSPVLIPVVTFLGFS